jgi:hypothetical protein
MQRLVVHRKSNEVSREHVASIFRIEEYAIEEICMRQLANCALKIEEASFSEVAADVQGTIWPYNPEDRRTLLTIHTIQNFKSRMGNMF